MDNYMYIVPYYVYIVTVTACYSPVVCEHMAVAAIGMKS